jgi:hypothetical protein
MDVVTLWLNEIGIIMYKSQYLPDTWYSQLYLHTMVFSSHAAAERRFARPDPN